MPWRAERAPRLTLRFVLWTALGLTVAAAAVCALLHQTLARQAEGDAVGRSRLTADVVLGAALRERDFTAPVAGARLAQLDQLFRRAVLVEGTVRASLYDKHGDVVYSTDRGLIGAASGAGWVANVRAGDVVSSIKASGGSYGRL